MLTFRQKAVRTAILGVGIVAALEGALRLGVSLRLPWLAQPDLYADWTSDADYWKLRHLWVSRVAPAENPNWDATLGWSEVDLNKAFKAYPESTRSRPSMIFVGDSFIRGEGPSENRLTGKVARQFPTVNVFNLGEQAYGWDQTYIKAQVSRPQLGKPVVVAGLLTLGLDRSVLEFRTGLKPYLAVVDGELRFMGRPVEKNPDRWLAENPPTLSPYLLTVLKSQWSRLGRQHVLENENGRELKQQVGHLFLKHWAAEAKAVGYPLVFVVFYDRMELSYSGWREQFLKKELDSLGVSYVDTKEILRRGAGKGGNPAKFYTKAGLLNADGNALIAEGVSAELAKFFPRVNPAAVN